MAMTTAMASSGLVAPSNSRIKGGYCAKGLPAFQASARVRAVSSLQEKMPKLSLSKEEISAGGSALAGAVFAAMASTDSAMAAQQIMELAAEDNRGAAILIPLVPAVGWVLYNILQPALNQLDRMRSAKSLAIGLGIGAAVSGIFASQASAVQEIADIAADNDSRGTLLLLVLLPAVGWVLYNILQPALNQLNKMRSSKALVGGLGLGAASMLLASNADASQEIATLAADNDSRGLLILIVLVPAIGWVLFNILRPALNQLDKMRNK
ncbi:hypothetical protein KP509_33G057000 [Ceratopteris richardii]|nr:hypothetical protein KP509_33G057000 [Ceratopteris richardii]KAH7286063.1 hypothetical protein KP509_33G057000 [Ceratopteris richardii]KAH7286065.1 hypothetical protein KP509_33G057000 [Ceratopteris richardii]